LKKIIKEIFFNNIGLTCNFAELIEDIRKETGGYSQHDTLTAGSPKSKLG